MAWTDEGYGDADYLAAFHRLVMPIAREYGPELVLVSAGFDAARGDPLGGMALTPAGYAQMTAQLQTLGGGRVVIALEGGYNLRSISTSAAACLRVLLGEPPSPIERGPPKPQALLDIEVAYRMLAPHWLTLQPPKLPRELSGRARRPVQTKGGVRRRRGKRGPWWHKYL